MAWYSQGIKVVDYFVDGNGRWSFQEVASYRLPGAPTHPCGREVRTWARMGAMARPPHGTDDGDRESTAAMGDSSAQRRLRAVPGSPADLPGAASTETLMARVARGDQEAFAALYDRVGARVFGLVRRVLRDPSQSEEVTQEVMLQVWRGATRYDAARGSAVAWIMTLAHRRAVDRARSEQAARERDDRVAVRDVQADADTVAEQVELRFEHEQVREALVNLTDLQREAVELAYYGGYTYREVAELLDTPLGTIKTRMRDGLIRLRDSMGVSR